MTAGQVAHRVGPWHRPIALVGYTLRSCLPPRRLFAVLLPCVGAVLFGLLMWRARTIPRGLNAFGIACYAAIFVASFVNILTPRFANWTVFVFGPGTLFELSIGVWLLARGANREASIPGFRTALIA